MISIPDRQEAVALIREVNLAGARLKIACQELGITVRTYERWVKDGEVRADQRPSAKRPEPENKLSPEEKTASLNLMNQPEYADLPPSQVVPALADTGVYLASESTIYRILRESKQQQHRGRSISPVHREPVTHLATAPNQVWTWDIAWLPGPICGMYYRLYLIVDIFSRKVVGWEVRETESSAHAETLIRRAVLRENTLGSRWYFTPETVAR